MSYGTSPDTTGDVTRLEADMVKKFGEIDEAWGKYTVQLQFVQPLVERHPDWHMRRMGGHRWEVRNGLKDKTYYGKTLAIALCKALLEIP